MPRSICVFLVSLRFDKYERTEIQLYVQDINIYIYIYSPAKLIHSHSLSIYKVESAVVGGREPRSGPCYKC